MTQMTQMGGDAYLVPKGSTAGLGIFFVPCYLLGLYGGVWLVLLWLKARNE
ncbi:MAG TPA: hypothetical protein VN673_05765 [Clostridia bacterium]|nr:hypothetical protein [Clostridia bacterium]